MHDDASLYFGHYVNAVLDANTGIWCHCDDVNTTKISDLPEGVYTIESNKQTTRIKIK